MIRSSTHHAPRYVEIYNALRTNILAGVYPPGSQFPTEYAVMSQYGASRTTVRNALRLLQEDGMIVSKRGSGTTVAPLNDVNPFGYSRLTEVQDVNFCFTTSSPWEETASPAVLDTVLAPANVAGELEIPTGTEVYRVQWILSVNDAPYNYLTHYLRMDVTPNLDLHLQTGLHSNSLYRLISETYGLEFIEAREDLLPICASFIEARFLEVPEGTPLIRLCQTAHCQKGPMEYCESVLNPNLMKISFSLGRRTIPSSFGPER